MSFTCRPVARPLHHDASLSGRERALFRKRGAREALRQSALASGVRIEHFARTPEGVPASSDGWFWSLSHGSRMCAAVVSPRPVGIDVEQIRPRRQSLANRICERDECLMFGGFSWEVLARVWTAKEAVLKKLGVGLARLSDCRVICVPQHGHWDGLVLDVAGTRHRVLQRVWRGHVLALAFDGKRDFEVNWHLDSDAITEEERA